MKQKIKKEYIKTNLIGFIIAGIIVSGVAVCAAVTFPSNEVSYSNTESGLNSNNVQGAIDELYETCTALTAGEQIIEDAGLEKDPYECRYFFTGANPNNYITFNGENAGWRIVSVECDGTIKIMRMASIAEQKWDTSGSNNWARPASLNTYLNGTYLNGLTSTAKSQIVAKDFSIGAVIDDNNNLTDQINDENSKKWNGKIALPTVSEYLRSNSNQSSCGTLWNNDLKYEQCQMTNWMDTTAVSYWWTLSPDAGNSDDVFSVYSNGRVGSYIDGFGNYAVRPVVYLSSEVKITGGTGTQNDPFTISL